MPARLRLLRRLMPGLVIIMMISGCSSRLAASVPDNSRAVSAEGPSFSLLVGGNELAASSNRQLTAYYREGITLKELLKSSAIASFSNDSRRILSVNSVSLKSELEWQLEVNGRAASAEDLDSQVDKQTHIVISAQSAAASDPLQTLILAVDGGASQPDLSHSYVMPFRQESSVRALLKSSGMVQLSEDKRSVVTVKEYTPLTSESWQLLVNGKPLLAAGMDMKLRPQDVLKISLVQR